MSDSNSLKLRVANQTNEVLELELARDTDRFISTLRLWTGDHATTVLRSREGDHREAWPPSPVIQDLSKQEGSPGTFLAGLGMAGNSHWSVVITALPEDAAIDLDFACRVKHEPKWLGSTYSICSADARLESSTCLKLGVGDVGIRCQTIGDDCPCQISANSGQFALTASLEPTGELPRTLRWKYRFSMH